jgi:hypothetical protein
MVILGGVGISFTVVCGYQDDEAFVADTYSHMKSMINSSKNASALRLQYL